MTHPQASEAEQKNFPQLLLQQLSAIKAAAGLAFAAYGEAVRYRASGAKAAADLGAAASLV